MFHQLKCDGSQTIMWHIIINILYRQSQKSVLAAARRARVSQIIENPPA